MGVVVDKIAFLPSRAGDHLVGEQVQVVVDEILVFGCPGHQSTGFGNARQNGRGYLRQVHRHHDIITVNINPVVAFIAFAG